MIGTSLDKSNDNVVITFVSKYILIIMNIIIINIKAIVYTMISIGILNG